MKVCIGLLTARRDHYTAQAVRSFVEHNDPKDPRFELVHMAESIDGDEMIADVAAHGFELIGKPKVRIGHHAACRHILEVATERGCGHIVINENDWIWVKPFPWWVLESGLEFETCRLFGAMKHRDPPRGTGMNSMVTGRPLDWRLVTPGVERAMAHYVPSSITRTDVLAPWARLHPTYKSMARSRDLDSVRLLDNVTWSIGEEHTADFMH